MHGISFQLKRAHLVTNAYAQKAVEKIGGMTPARYDVLALLREDSLRAGSPQLNNLNCMYQKTIGLRLGLHHSTVSKMLKRMEEMEWIRRRRAIWHDRRSNMVELTELGLRRAAQAMQRVYRTRALLTPFEKVARQLRPTQHVTEALTGIWDTIDGIARFFDDGSWFTYTHGLTPKACYALPVECPSAWDILCELQKRGPRTSLARYLKKIEWRHAAKCVFDVRFKPGRNADSHGDARGAACAATAPTTRVATMTRGCAVGTRLKACAKLRGTPMTCRRRFPGRASADSLAMRRRRMECEDLYSDEIYEDDDDIVPGERMKMSWSPPARLRREDG